MTNNRKTALVDMKRKGRRKPKFIAKFGEFVEQEYHNDKKKFLTDLCAFDEDVLPTMKTLRQVIQQEKQQKQKIQKEINKKALRLPYTEAISRRQYEKIRSIFLLTNYRFPCHQSTANQWNNQQQFSGEETPNDFFDRVSTEFRMFMVPFENSTFLPLRYRFCWIFYLLYSHLEDLVGIISINCVLKMKFFLWYDGGKILKRKGLAVGLKICDVDFINAERFLELPDYLVSLVKDPCWLILAVERAETSTNVSMVEDLLLYSLKELMGQNIVYNDIRLQVEYLGFTADHGIRSKTLCRINGTSGRCGECSWLFCQRIPYGCLDWGTLIQTEIISFNNWNAHRHEPMPERIYELAALSPLGLLTYDADCYMLYWEDVHFDTILYNVSVKDNELFQRLAQGRRGRGNSGNSSM